MMTEAYRMLYEIEVGLREWAEEIMNKHHGHLWRRKLDEERKEHFYHTLSLFGKYEQLQTFFTPSERSHLYKLIPIRNKICHMQLLTIEEYEFLASCYAVVAGALQNHVLAVSK
ncbi:hypothetical protein [Priestia koreensis]|uniref:hypothetical protein n=1 Tax=Priestia koreensis TaxID=284581 RepID=UPI002041C314|nr:hypothetical protein [Priestia koreensis]MCM3006869.1 hypothetical protein [Priestia koreensis]